MALITSILVQIGEWVLTTLFAVLQKDYEQYKAQKQAAADAKAKADQLKNATTAQEIDKATDSTLSNL